MRRLLTLSLVAALAACRHGPDKTVGPGGKPVARFDLTALASQIPVGGTLQLTATPRDADGNVVGAPVTFSSSNAGMATVDATFGLVTGVAVGHVTITALTSNDVTASKDVEVVQGSPAPVATISLAPNPAAVYVNWQQQLVVTLRDANNALIDPSSRAVTWASSDLNTASVDASGKVTAVAIGSASITATCEGHSAQATVNVNAAPVFSLTVMPTNPTLIVGATQALSVVAKDQQSNVLTGRTITYASDNTAIATVSGTGVITAKAAGSATITISSESVNTTLQVTVSPTPVATVAVTLTPTSIIAGTTTAQASAVTKDANNAVLSGRTVTWSSSNTAVATVNATTGVVTGVGAGTANIIGTSEGKTGQAAITVTPAVASVTVASNAGTSVQVGQPGVKVSATAKDGSGATVSGRTVQWTSSNTSVATVDANGNVTLLAPGSVTITGKVTPENVSGSIALTVALAPVATVTVSPAADTIDGTFTRQMTAVLKDQWGNTLTNRTVAWSTNNSGVATVSGAGGLVTGADVNATGIATITATSEGQSGSAAITVQRRVAQVLVASPSATVYVNGDFTLSITLKDKNGGTLNNADYALSYVSASPSKATVNGSGLVHGVQQGSTTITISVDNVSTTVDLSVLSPVATVLVNPNDFHLTPGLSQTLTVTLKDAQGNTLDNATRQITFTSSDATIASVSSAGVVTANNNGKTGTVTVTVTSEGKSDTAIVRVP